MKYKIIKQVWEYKHLEQYFTWKWEERFQMFDLYVSWKMNYRQIWEQFWWTTKQRIAYCCKQVYNKIIELQKYKDNQWNIYTKTDWFFTPDEIDRRVKMWDLILIK